MRQPNLKSLQLRGQRGQVLILVAIALPVFLAFTMLVIDGSLGYVKKREMQNAADAAALAAARETSPALGSCDPACMAAVQSSVAAVATDYSEQNGWSGSPLPECAQPSDTNCYTWPYKGSNGKVEVRLRSDVNTFFTNLFGHGPGFLKAGARAVASAGVGPATHCHFPHIDGQPDIADGPDADQYLTTTPPCTIPGQLAEAGSAHCLFSPPVDDPDQYLNTTPPCTGPPTGGVNGATALVMSRECDAISYTGAGGGSVGTFVTNGGIWFQGSQPKRVAQLAYDQPGCPDHPTHPPSGDTSPGQCDNSNNFLCAKVLVDFSAQTPINWPVPPPPEPSPLPPNTTWDPSIHYPSRCIDLGTTNRAFAPSDGPPGIYCLRGGATLTLSADFTAGDGYTFFALGGGKIANSGGVVKFYWPSACGARPTSRPASFTCFGRTISGYDPQTLFYATNTVHSASKCDDNAICINGGTSKLVGDLFAVAPSVFPPPQRSP